MEALVFETLELITVPVKIAGEDYILQEAGETFAAKYKDEQMKSTRVAEDTNGIKRASVEGLSNTEALLVSFCLFKIGPNNSKASVNINTIKTWPHRIVSALFDKAEEISGLGVKETEEVLRKRLKDTQDKLGKLVASKPSNNGDSPHPNEATGQYSTEDAVKN